MNNALVQHYYEGGNLSSEHIMRVQDLDKHGFIPANKKMDTYSGVGFDIRNVKHVGVSKEGHKVYHQPAYLSSSISKHTASAFADEAAENNESDEKHILHWHHDKGQSVGVIGKHSKHEYEHEVLVPRTDSTHHKYHIEHLKTETYMEYGKPVHVHHVRRIPESEIIKK